MVKKFFLVSSQNYPCLTLCLLSLVLLSCTTWLHALSNLPGGTAKLLLCHINHPKPSLLQARQVQFPQHLLIEHMLQVLPLMALC